MKLCHRRKPVSHVTARAGTAVVPDQTSVSRVTGTLLSMLWRTGVPAAVRLEGMTPIAVFVTPAQVEALLTLGNPRLFGYKQLLKAVFCFVFFSCSSSVCGGPPTEVGTRSGNRPEYVI